MDDCPICDRVSIWQPLRGTFDLKGTSTAFAYQVTNVNFVTDLTDSPEYRISGGGTLNYETGEPVLTLDLSILRAGITENVHLTNDVPENPRIFPMIGAQANEAPGSITRVYRLRIQAAPVRELWYSTTASFTKGTIGIPEDAAISHGDLLANTGRVVKRNAQLTERLAIPEGDIGLDAVDVGPRGEIFFSSTSDVESFVVGPISDGDMLSAGGRLYLQSAHLLNVFGVEDPDAGLDALHVVSDAEVYFSISKEVTRTNNTKLRRGDKSGRWSRGGGQ